MEVPVHFNMMIQDDVTIMDKNTATQKHRETLESSLNVLTPLTCKQTSLNVEMRVVGSNLGPFNFNHNIVNSRFFEKLFGKLSKLCFKNRCCMLFQIVRARKKAFETDLILAFSAPSSNGTRCQPTFLNGPTFLVMYRFHLTEIRSQLRDDCTKKLCRFNIA